MPPRLCSSAPGGRLSSPAAVEPDQPASTAGAKADKCARDPIGVCELAGIFHEIDTRPRVALAVSGGADSMALMCLFQRWLEADGRDPSGHLVLTVDHGVRSESAEEADWVAAQASVLGLAHRTLRWTGDKPASGLQAAARAARYDLMAEACAERAISCLVTAHHADDQAETMVMRLARGAGPDGLAAIPRQGRWGDLDLCRPLLGLPKARLVATLRAFGIAWREDRSNLDERYERNRARALLAALGEDGLDAAAWARSANRLARAVHALETTAAQAARACVRADPGGYCRIDRRRLSDLAPDIALRVLRRCLRAVGGPSRGASLSSAEAVLERLGEAEPGSWTVSGCRMSCNHKDLLVTREPGREGLPFVDLCPGARAVWDERVHICISASVPEPVRLGPLGADGFRSVRARIGRAVAIPAPAGMVLPALWSAQTPQRLLAVPRLGYFAEQIARTSTVPGAHATAIRLPCRAVFDTTAIWT